MDASTHLVFVLFLCACLRPFFVHGGFTTTKIGPRPLWNATFTDKLRQDLLLNYDKFARPSPHQNTTKVTFNFVIRHVEVNEFKSTLTVYGATKLIWTDEKLKWNESDYGEIEKLNMADHEIWQPDLILFNSGVRTPISHYNSHCIVYKNGDVVWNPSTQFTVLCDLNLKYWPFDKQTCNLKIGSWTHNVNEIDLEVLGNRTDVPVAEIIKSTEWTIGETSMILGEKISYNCCFYSHQLITITVNLIRRSPSYSALIITPAFVTIALILSSFWLPPQAGEKIILNGCTAIIITLFLLYFTQKIPAMGSHTPLIVFFYSSCLWVICFSVIGSVIVIWLSRTRHAKPLPWLIKRLLSGWLGRCLSLRNHLKNTATMDNVTAEEMRDHQVTDFEDNTINDNKQFISPKYATHDQNEWVTLAVAIDRLSFVFYTFLFLILSITYSI